MIGCATCLTKTLTRNVPTNETGAHVTEWHGWNNTVLALFVGLMRIFK